MTIVLCGPGGVGKGTVAGEVARLLPRLCLSKSWTTRDRRVGEPDDAYTFVSRERFEVAAKAGCFLEWEEFGGNLYGTPRPSSESDRVLFLEIDVQGAKTIRRIEPSSLIIALEPPSMEVLRNRMTQRGDDVDHIQRRLVIAADEMAQARAVADHVVVNNELSEAVTAVVKIIEAWLAG